jgi:hypothetical protein
MKPRKTMVTEIETTPNPWFQKVKPRKMIDEKSV